MVKKANIKIDKELLKNNDSFIKNIQSNMYFKSAMSNNSMSFDWVDEFEFACNYIDNIVRNPKYVLIDEESTVKIEKAKKITVASIKDLSRHTNYIEEINEESNDVRPSKILIVNKEETFNIYENRFIFTLINNMIRFMNIKEKELKNLEIVNEKKLEYASATVIGDEKVEIQLNINSKEIPDIKDNKFANEIKQIKKRIKRIKQYITSWQRSEFMQQLTKLHVPEVKPPITKTNIILKNPNFQIAMKLWLFLQTYSNKNSDDAKIDLDTKGNNIIRAILDDTFLTNYYVLDSISSSKRAQKEKLSKYAILMIRQHIQLAMAILLNSGIDVSEDEILKMIADEMKKEKEKINTDSAVVKNKFKDAINEYLEKTKEYM